MAVWLETDTLNARSMCFLEIKALAGSILLRNPQALFIF